ncbi:hypothetical protein CNY89_28250, partial [Amaricoccus sp. HAR-UPW-R2A-40]
LYEPQELRLMRMNPLIALGIDYADPMRAIATGAAAPAERPRADAPAAGADARPGSLYEPQELRLMRMNPLIALGIDYADPMRAIATGA